jgi:serine phosphatase RsbU (regulator of sigma subunit)
MDAVADPARLHALEERELLDSPAESAFDRLTALAAAVLDVPISLISLVTADRQFFKSQCGLPGPVAEARETPLSHSFCQHVVGAAAPLIVEDARREPLVAANLAVRDLEAIAYAGVPLRTADGQVLGSFCAIDHRPRRWSAADLALLEQLAAATMDVVELRERALTGIRAATRLQAALVPDVAPLRRGSIATFYRPGEDRLLLGGDFFGVAERDDGAVDVLVGDVAGRGPEAAAFAAVLRSAWEVAADDTPVGQRLALLDRAAAPRMESGLFASAVCLHLPPDRATALVAAAGHPPPILITGSAAVEAEVDNGPLLGVAAPGAVWPVGHLDLRDQDAVLLYTDGLAEGRVAPGSDERLGSAGLAGLVTGRLEAGHDGPGLLAAVVEEAIRRDGAAATDDVAAVLLRPR